MCSSSSVRTTSCSGSEGWSGSLRAASSDLSREPRPGDVERRGEDDGENEEDDEDDVEKVDDEALSEEDDEEGEKDEETDDESPDDPTCIEVLVLPNTGDADPMSTAIDDRLDGEADEKDDVLCMEGDAQEAEEDDDEEEGERGPSPSCPADL